jgi:hypothetical protein
MELLTFRPAGFPVRLPGAWAYQDLSDSNQLITLSMPAGNQW